VEDSGIASAAAGTAASKLTMMDTIQSCIIEFFDFMVISDKKDDALNPRNPFDPLLFSDSLTTLKIAMSLYSEKS
jgi:hypothetical protein